MLKNRKLPQKNKRNNFKGVNSGYSSDLQLFIGLGLGGGIEDKRSYMKCPALDVQDGFHAFLGVEKIVV